MHNRTLSSIVEQAELAFWAKVAELIPEATSGDLPLHEQLAISSAMETAVQHWINLNGGQTPDGAYLMVCNGCLAVAECNDAGMCDLCDR